MQDAIKILKESPIATALISVSDEKIDIAYANKLFLELFPNDVPQELKDAITKRENVAALSLTLAKKGGIGIVKITHDNDHAVVWIIDTSESHIATEEAEALAQAKSNFLATMSHEIRSPMQSIYGFLELINEENISDKVRGMLTTARKSSSELLEILDDILDLAKVEANKIELDDFETPIHTLARGVIEAMEVKVFSDSVKLETEIDDDVPFMIMGDPTRIRQILLNLIGNSIKFTERGFIRLLISAKTQHIKLSEGEIGLRFEIEDTGIGMPKEAAEDLFKPFTQADSSTSRKYGGTGLGLSISHKLIEFMGGEIGVSSVEGMGSIFWVEIPTRAANEQNSVELPDLEGIAVLSIENQDCDASEVMSALSSMGATVVCASTYTDGIELVDQRPFDVAVVDQNLPDGLGIDILKYASKMRPFMGLILYTVYNDMGMQYSAKNIGAKYLAKPSSRFGLGEAVKAASKKMEGPDYKGPSKLLIAEDTEAVREVIKLQLEKLSIEADFVENGKEALKALDTNEYGVLVTDLHMPVMDGYELVKIIRDREGGNDDKKMRFPIIALTADVQIAQKQAYLAHGFDECLLKPVSLGQLKQLLIRWGVLKKERPDEKQTEERYDAEDISGRLIETTVEKHSDVTTEEKQKQTSKLPPAVDRNAIIEQMGGLDKTSIGMLDMFIDMTQPYIEKIDRSFKNKDMHTLRENAHSLKGAARSACCPILGDLAEKIQNEAESNEEIKESLIKDIEKEFLRVEKAIQALSEEEF